MAFYVMVSNCIVSHRIISQCVNASIQQLGHRKVWKSRGYGLDEHFWRRPSRTPLDLETPMGHPMGVWFEILKDCWPCMCFQCRNLRRSDTQHALYLRLFGDLLGGSGPGTPMGHPMGIRFKILKFWIYFFMRFISTQTSVSVNTMEPIFLK